MPSVRHENPVVQWRDDVEGDIVRSNEFVLEFLPSDQRMASKYKGRPESPYDLSSISRERAKDATQSVYGSRRDGPYTLRKEHALSTLRAKLQKSEPK